MYIYDDNKYREGKRETRALSIWCMKINTQHAHDKLIHALCCEISCSNWLPVNFQETWCVMVGLLKYFEYKPIVAKQWQFLLIQEGNGKLDMYMIWKVLDIHVVSVSVTY